MPCVAQPGGDALAELQARWQMTTASRPANSGAQSAARPMGRRNEPGIEPRIGGEILVGADVDRGRGLRRADEAGELFGGDRVD